MTDVTTASRNQLNDNAARGGEDSEQKGAHSSTSLTRYYGAVVRKGAGMRLASDEQMKFSATEVSRIASQAAREVSDDLAVTGVTITGGDTGYTEVHVTVRGCHTEPCKLTLSVFRDVSEDALRLDIIAGLRAHLEQHPVA
jgi:hypothetical protein